MADKNFKLGDLVTLCEPWQMLGFGELPHYHKGFMVIVKRTRSGKYQCIVPWKRQTVSLAKSNLTLYDIDKAQHLQ